MTISQVREEKDQLFRDIWNGEIPKRVPVIQAVDIACALDKAGYSLLREQYSPEKCLEAMDYVTEMIDSDILPITMGVNPTFNKVLGSIKMKPGADGYMQHANISVMEADEYPQLIEDPYAYMLNVVAPRLLTKYNGTPEEKSIVLVKAYIAQQLYMKKMIPGRQAIIEKYDRSAYDHMLGIVVAPFDNLADFMRSFTNSLNDCRRRPQQVLDAVDALTSFELKRVDSLAPGKEGGRAFLALHMPTFMNMRDFEKFWWPSFVKVLEHLHATGRGIHIFCEDNWDRYLDHLYDLPENTLMAFEKTDPKKAKEKLGKKHILSGFFPMQLYRSGSVSECVDTTKEYLDILAPGGRYMFKADKSPIRGTDIKQENLSAVITTVKEYGVY